MKPYQLRKMLYWMLLALLAGAALIGTAGNQPPGQAASAEIQRGRYLGQVAACNDCHTHGYPEAAGQIDEKQWLLGSSLGWSGPWGTTYPGNLRLVMQSLSEDQWMAQARSERRPPMPWFLLRDMTDEDLKAIYHYIRSLGSKGEPAPAYAPPGQAVNTPYIEFFPKNLPQQVAK